MSGHFRLVTPARLDALLAEPASLPTYLARMEDTEGRPREAGALLDVDKAWHGLHFLLTGTAWEGAPPLNFIAAGGTVLGDVDLGCGPARAFTPAELAEVARALEGVTPEVLRQRFAPARMVTLGIYPHIWERAAQRESLAYLLAHFAVLRTFVRRGAAEGMGLLVYLREARGALGGPRAAPPAARRTSAVPSRGTRARFRDAVGHSSG